MKSIVNLEFIYIKNKFISNKNKLYQFQDKVHDQQEILEVIVPSLI